MLIILMAIIDFSRARIYAATRWLWLALSGGLLIAGPFGCQTQTTYGVPYDVNEYDYNVPDDVEQDVIPVPVYGPEVSMEIPAQKDGT